MLPTKHASKHPPESMATYQSRCIHAFSLIEMMVIIVIIGVLVGIMVPVGQSVINSSKKRKTANTLRKAHSIIDVYFAHTQKILTLPCLGSDTTCNPFDYPTSKLLPTNHLPGINTLPSEYWQVPPINRRHTTAALFWLFRKSPELKDLASRFDDEELTPVPNYSTHYPEDRNLILVDAWGNAITYAPYVHRSTNSVQPNSWKSVTNYLPHHPDPFFASSGVDGVFAQNTDDLYSFTRAK